MKTFPSFEIYNCFFQLNNFIISQKIYKDNETIPTRDFF